MFFFHIYDVISSFLRLNGGIAREKSEGKNVSWNMRIPSKPSRYKVRLLNCPTVGSLLATILSHGAGTQQKMALRAD